MGAHTNVIRGIVAAVALLAAACADDAAPTPASPTTTSTSAAEPAPTAAPSTSGPTTTSTSTTTVVPPSTTAAAPTLRHDGTPMIRFSVAVGDGVDLTRDELASFIVETLRDGRSWIGRGAGFELVDEGGDFTMIVALPDDVDEMCAPLQTNGIFSCAHNGWIAFNSLRWFGATADWPADLETYRRYLVNHEVGHYIVGPNHDTCPGVGQIAPVMMQQTKGLDGCEANGWVDP